MNKYMEILKAIDVTRITNADTIEIPMSFIENDEELKTVLNVRTGSVLGHKEGSLGAYKIKVMPTVRVSDSRIKA